MTEKRFERRDTETQSDFLYKDLTQQIIGAAIEVHRQLGPGLLESAYEECLCHELVLRKIAFVRQVNLPVTYKGVKLDCGYRIDLLVEDLVIGELKCVENLLPVHEAQLFTYLRLAEKPVGLLFNFYIALLTKGGMVRKVLSKPSSLSASASLR